MTRKIHRAAALVLLLASLPLFAHHSGAMFDRTKKVTVTGTVVKFQYVNPHSWIDVNVKSDDGTETIWAFEGGAPMQMRMAGLTPDILKAGDKVTITGHPLRDGRSAGAYIQIVLPDGSVRTTRPYGRPPGPAIPPSGPAPDNGSAP
jgi:hypothetical protein